jgi:hypothetical protein
MELGSSNKKTCDVCGKEVVNEEKRSLGCVRQDSKEGSKVWCLGCYYKEMNKQKFHHTL